MYQHKFCIVTPKGELQPKSNRHIQEDQIGDVHETQGKQSVVDLSVYSFTMCDRGFVPIVQGSIEGQQPLIRCPVTLFSV